MAEEDKTEKATPKRRDEARDEGKVARSQDVTTVAMMLAGAVCFLSPIGEAIAGGMMDIAHDAWSQQIAPPGTMADYHALMLVVARRLALLLAPMALIFASVAIAANVAQVGFKITPKVFVPKFTMFNIFKGLKRLVSVDKLVELAKAIVKLSVTIGIVHMVTHGAFDVVFSLMDAHPAESMRVARELVEKLIWILIVVLAIFAVLDYVWQVYRFEKQIRMSKQEVRDENKQKEGDPEVKKRIRSKQRQLAINNMINAVEKADVVVTNPTHYAVALQYRPPVISTPIILAKGRNHLAFRIREEAKANRIPIVENPPLAQLLYKAGEIDQEIPETLYKAVAEVLAYVYRLNPQRASHWRMAS